MAKVITIGLSKIEVGDIAVDGGMGTSLAVLGETYEDSCTIETEDATITEHFVEEFDDPIVSKSKRGKSTLTFQIANPSIDAMVEVLGGTKVNKGTLEDPEYAWESPLGSVAIEQSIKVTPEQGYVLEFPRAKIDAKWEGGYGRNQILLLTVVATVLMPTKNATSAMTMYDKASV